MFDLEILYSEPIDLELVADLCALGLPHPDSPPAPRDRSKFHVSNLLESAHLISRGDVRYHEFVNRPKSIMSLGRVWEVVMDTFLTHYAANLGGFYTSDIVEDGQGIIASLDGGMWLPMRHLQQMRAYCHLFETDLVCYVSGHLSSTPPSADASLRIIRMTKQEVAETWQGIISTKEYLEQCGITPCVITDKAEEDKK